MALPPHLSVQKLEGKRDLSECRAIRRAVFIEEQNVPENEEWDGLDALYNHYLLKEDGKPIGTARAKINPMSEAKLGRVCLLKDARGKGTSRIFMQYLLDDLVKTDKNLKSVKISAQTSAVPFYEKFGFQKTGNEYMEANIPHFAMQWVTNR